MGCLVMSPWFRPLHHGRELVCHGTGSSGEFCNMNFVTINHHHHHHLNPKPKSQVHLTGVCVSIGLMEDEAADPYLEGL